MGNFLSRTTSPPSTSTSTSSEEREEQRHPQIIEENDHENGINALNSNGILPSQPSLVIGGIDASSPMHFFLSIPLDNGGGGGGNGSNDNGSNAGDGRRVSPRRTIENRSPHSDNNENINENIERQLVLVRVLSLPTIDDTTTGNTTTGNTSAGNTTIDDTTTDNATTDNANVSNNLTMYQWSIYFLTPTDSEGIVETELAPTLQNQTVQRALLIVRSILNGSGITAIPDLTNGTETYEDLLRLQERIGFVTRGVEKKEIEECLQAIPLSQANGTRCPICLANWLDSDDQDLLCRTLPCQHSYHTHCIDTWLVINNSCPQCRKTPIQRKSGDGRGGVKRSLI